MFHVTLNIHKLYHFRPYFETKARFNQLLDDQKRQVQLIEETIQMTKSGYSNSLKELEKISEEIHQKRQAYTGLGERERGVGSESPDQVDGAKGNVIAPLKALTSQ